MLCNNLVIRDSHESESQSIRRVETIAYGRKAEANLVDQLVPTAETTISLVAECDGKIVGHILLTKIDAPVKALALVPLAVVPAFREMQVGSALVRGAINRAREKKFMAIFALGDKFYYERFGFSSTKADPFTVKWQGTNFMALELVPNALQGKAGKLAYPEVFYKL